MSTLNRHQPPLVRQSDYPAIICPQNSHRLGTSRIHERMSVLVLPGFIVQVIAQVNSFGEKQQLV